MTSDIFFWYLAVGAVVAAVGVRWLHGNFVDNIDFTDPAMIAAYLLITIGGGMVVGLLWPVILVGSVIYAYNILKEKNDGYR